MNVLAGVVGCAVIPVAVLRRGVELPAVMIGLVALAPGLATGFLAFTFCDTTTIPGVPLALRLRRDSAVI
ncbi:hypothetical protein ACWZHB_18815 [Nocardia sp. FBN12]|uniref:hypothetical protein n=1 Tax=Nocardia sp. FBN12 TaxID=3419766 RepID=UPI003CFC22D5